MRGLAEWDAGTTCTLGATERISWSSEGGQSAAISTPSRLAGAAATQDRLAMHQRNRQRAVPVRTAGKTAVAPLYRSLASAAGAVSQLAGGVTGSAQGERHWGRSGGHTGRSHFWEALQTDVNA